MSEEFSESIQVKITLTIKLKIDKIVNSKISVTGMRYTKSDFIREAIYDKLQKEGIDLKDDD